MFFNGHPRSVECTESDQYDEYYQDFSNTYYDLPHDAYTNPQHDYYQNPIYQIPKVRQPA